MEFDQAKHAWSILNFVFAIVSIAVLSLKLRLDTLTGAAFALLCLSQPAFGILLDNGQHGMLILMSVVLGVAAMDSHRSLRVRSGAILYGVSFLKYSFAPSFAAALIRYRGIKTFLLSLLPVLVGLVVFIALFGPNRETVFGPLLCAADSVNQVTAKMSDLMTIIHASAPAFYESYKAFVALACVLLSFVVPLLFPSRNPWEIAAFAAVCSLSFLKHLPYDHVLLWIPLGYFLGMTGRTKLSWAGIGLLSWFWLVNYYEPFIRRFYPGENEFVQADIVIGFFVNLSLLLLIHICSLFNRRLRT
jgi:hypothetical protein